MLFNSEGIGGSGDLMHRASFSLVADTGGRIGDVSIPKDANDSVRTLFEYWLSMSPDGRLPGRRHFDPTGVPFLLPNTWLIDVHRDPTLFWRRLVGTKIEEFAGKSPQGGWVADRLNGDRLSSVNRHLTQVVETLRPSWRRGKSLIQFEKKYSEIERLYLPLAADDETVDMNLAISVIFTKDRQWA